jgi:hypothetical protein
MQSSGNSEIDASAVKDILGVTVALPNQRMWFEWLPIQIEYDDQGSHGAEAAMPDCSGLDHEARIKAKVR